MIVVYPYSLSDQELALKNAEWIEELGGAPNHDCAIIHDPRCDAYLVENIEGILKRCFKSANTIPAHAEIDGWPEGANYFFRLTAAMLQGGKWPYFFWMEADAIPLVGGWADAIEADHKRGGKPFSGDRVQVENIPLHMSGVGIYPNPLHAFAGEAYRAHEVAWDMAGKDQIVPQAHFTKLIEHAWKHPKFTSIDELQTQIRPEAVLFHSSKDGSLIDLLRGRKHQMPTSKGPRDVKHRPNQPKEPDEPGSPSPITFPGDKAASGQKPTDNTAMTVPRTRETPSLEEIGNHAVQPVCDIFIRTYPGDYDWLYYCLLSIRKFCTGFRKIWIVSPAQEPVWFVPGDRMEWKVLNEESEDHYLSQQIHKLYADVITDYQADNILHVDSDVIFHTPCTPEHFFSGHTGKPFWYYTSYSEIQAPWQPITEKFMGEPVEFEFMRRFPLIVPRWLYAKLREYCHIKHGMIISAYIRLQPNRAFSEFNALGAYAFSRHRDKFEWLNTLETLPPPLAKQFHSWSGLTPDKKVEIESYLNGETPPEPIPEGGLPAGIRELANNLWVLERDVEISGWIEQSQRLDHDQNLLPLILAHIKDGDTVVDAGAFVGDHTIAYLQKVGKSGVVHAIEPNPLAMRCLKHNLGLNGDGNNNLHAYEVALGDECQGEIPLSSNNGNMGGAYLGTHMSFANVRVLPLDDLDIAPNFIKFDVEGSEVKALRGAEKTILSHHPTMVIEVNYEALKRQGDRVGDLFALLENWGYDWKILQENCGLTSPMYDIVCKPLRKTAPEEDVVFDVKRHCRELASFAKLSPQNKSKVMQHLVLAGLKEPAKKKKKKK